MFEQLQTITARPKPFEFYTVNKLWTDEHISKQMLEYHLDGTVNISSRTFTFIDESVNWISEYFQLSSASKVADFGCGPGLYTSRLAKKGMQVTGIDFSKRSIEYARTAARENRQRINYIHKNYLEFETEEKFDLIIMIFCDFCALSPEQRKTMLEKYYHFLKPKGHLLFDVHSLNIFHRKKESLQFEKNMFDGFWSENYHLAFIMLC